jgi:DNA adenine methylase
MSQKPFKAPTRYPGGKQRLCNWISEHFPEHVHEMREPFVGGGSIFLKARSMGLADSYWINDKFNYVTYFWRIVREPVLCEKLIRDLHELRASLTNVSQVEEVFHAMRAESPSDAYRFALIFFFINRTSFSGATFSGGFSKSAAMDRFTVSKINQLKHMPEALAGVRITKFDYERLVLEPPIKKGNDVLLVLDPPYGSSQGLYGKNGEMHKFDHEHMASLMKETKHKFLITYDDTDYVRSLYKFANIYKRELSYSMCNVSTKKQKIGRELILTNY